MLLQIRRGGTLAARLLVVLRGGGERRRRGGRRVWNVVLWRSSRGLSPGWYSSGADAIHFDFIEYRLLDLCRDLGDEVGVDGASAVRLVESIVEGVVQRLLVRLGKAIRAVGWLVRVVGILVIGKALIRPWVVG